MIFFILIDFVKISNTNSVFFEEQNSWHVLDIIIWVFENFTIEYFSL